MKLILSILSGLVAAVDANPVFIAAPCHCVVLSDGTSGGYARVLEMKAVMLAEERGFMPPARSLSIGGYGIARRKTSTVW